METEKKIYVGSGKQPHENIVNISVCLSDLPREHIFEMNGKKYIKLTVMKKKEVDKFGKSHTVTVDTWKPEKPKPNPTEKEYYEGQPELSNELPF